jgi:eukaryotic-like serine/threonine-protein kinase
MSADKPDDTRTHEPDFGAMWSSDGATRSFSPSATDSGLPADLPFLFSPGQHFGPYLIVRPLGKGGMGQVYEAEEVESGRRVAMKILSRGLGDDEERERFLNEGQLAASLSHPNTVYVFGTTEVQGFPVIAMELAPGGTLKELVVPGSPLPMARAIDAIMQVIAGLEAAAAIGILHRDIKPSNCFVDRDGRVLVGDFGLSMTTLARDEATLAVAGTIMGTPGFASPEQLRGEKLDVRSDIYSVGATIYYMLTGKAPFDDPNIMTMLTRVATEQAPQLAASRPDLPGRLGSVVAKCLAKKPADRYATYTALSAALEPFRSAALSPAPLPRRFLAGFLDSYVAALPIIPWNMYMGSIVDARNRTELLLAQVPGILVIVAYYAILEGRFGCGAGKAVLNMRVIDETQTAPGFRRALSRALIFLMPAQIVNLVLGFFALPSAGRAPAGNNSLLAPILAAVSIGASFAILAVLFSTVRRRNGFAGLHDLATRTRVVLRPRAVEARSVAPRAAAASQALATDGDRLGPYVVPAGVKGSALAAAAVVQGFDDRLRRPVWVEILPPGTPPLDARRRDLGRPTRTRWLSGRRTDAEFWDAYEALDGQPFLDAIASPQPWSRVRHWLADLSNEIAAGMKDDSLPSIAVDRIWIGSDDRARLLDWAPPGPSHDPGSSTIDHRLSDIDSRSAQQFLYGVAAGALRGVHPDTAREEPVAMPLPMPARTLLQALRTGAVDSLDTVREQAETQLRNPATVPIKRRATQMAVSAMFPVLLTMGAIGAIFLMQRSQTADPQAFALKACVGNLKSFENRGSKMTAGQREEVRLTEIYIAEHLREAVEESAAVARAFPAVNRAAGEHVLVERAIANHPQRSPEDVKKADAVVAKLIAEQSKGLQSITAPMAQWNLVLILVAYSSMFVGVLALVGSLVTRGGFTYRPFGTALVKADGSLAGRIRAFLRTLMSWFPLAILCTLVYLGPGPNRADLILNLLNTAVLLLFIGCAVWGILHPSRGIQDRFAGTWIVPR